MMCGNYQVYRLRMEKSTISATKIALGGLSKKLVKDYCGSLEKGTTTILLPSSSGFLVNLYNGEHIR